MAEWLKPSYTFKDCRDLDSEYVSDWCGHGFSQPFLLTHPGLIKAYDFLSSLFIMRKN